jgi:hypothetical protein
MTKIIDSVKEKRKKLFPSMFFSLWIISLILFVLWLVFIWPLDNIKKDSVNLSLKNEGELNITYPQKIRVGDTQESSIDMKLDRAYSTRVQVIIPPELSLTGLEPPGTLVAGNNRREATTVVLDWDNAVFNQHRNLLFPGAVIDEDGDNETKSAWIEWDDDLSAILANNIRLKVVNTRLANPSRFYDLVELKICQFPCLGHDSVYIPIKVETVWHSRWRLFAEKYSIVAIVPVILAALTYLGEKYDEKRRRTAILNIV